MTASNKDIAQQARFVFIGLVVKRKAATMPQVPVTDSTAIVKVLKVFHVPEVFGDWTNQEITVHLSGSMQIEEGQQYVFHTDGWIFGDSIAVNALEEQPVTEADLKREVSDPVQELADRDLLAHVARADLIVVGKVTTTRLPATSTKAAGSSEPPVPVTRKHPRRHEAVIEIESVEKGIFPDKEVVVLFHTSTDVAWHKSPKFKPGDEGIFMLHRIEEPETEVLYSCHNELDFQPWSKLDQIRSYIKFSANP